MEITATVDKVEGELAVFLLRGDEKNEQHRCNQRDINPFPFVIRHYSHLFFSRNL